MKFDHLILAALAAALAVPVAAQTTVDDDDQSSYGDIIVSASVRQGGSQDIRHFRKTAETGMPRPEMLSVEGLLGEHDLTLPTSTPCRQMFCLVAEAAPATLPSRPNDTLFVGLGFATGIDEKLYRRPPLNLVAVVDKSGSMDGEPLALVRQSLRQVVAQMTDDDQLSIVLYGDRSHVWMAPQSIRGHRRDILARIDAIASNGSTNMEEGLKVGYRVAFDSQAGFKGQTRLMLFTDENPNVGDTSAQGFMAMARQASARDVGLTTIGVGQIFDDQLALKLSSVRGGNQFFIDDAAAVTQVFTKQFETMGGELAHDLTITMTPAAGWAATGVFGVPGELMTSGTDGTTTVTIPTVFLSTNGGGIYVTMGKATNRADLPAPPIAAGGKLLTVALSYREARSKQPGSDRVEVVAPVAGPSVPLRLSQALVDQFLTMRDATSAYHVAHEPKTAFSLLSNLENRLKAASLPQLATEIKLVDAMRAEAAYFSGYASELPRNIRHRAIAGRWLVVSTDGFKDIRRGDMMTFDEEGTLTTERSGKAHGDEREDESYEASQNELFLRGSDIVFRWRMNGDKLTLVDAGLDGTATIALRRQ